MGTNSYICRSYRGKTGGRGGSFAPVSLFWIGLQSVTIKQGWLGFYYLQELCNTYVFYTWHFLMMHVLSPDIIYTTCVQNGLVRNDSDISQWTWNLYHLSVRRLYGAFERELIHSEISFCEVSFCVYWFLGISRFISKSVNICLHQICFVFLPMQINPFKVFVEFIM